MRRKLIKQGGTGLTFYVPKKWVDQKNLQSGDEIEIQPAGENLLISTTEIKHKLKEITLNIPKSQETALRTLIVNAYRAGYDKLIIDYKGSTKDLQKIVTNYLIGFELFPKEKFFLLESVAEPSYENFENIIQKQFFIILEMLKDLSNKELFVLDAKVKKYDNFLKRCLSKKIYHTEALPLIWQFLSELTHISREIYHFSKSIKNINKREQDILKEINSQFLLLQKAYLTKNYQHLIELHNIQENTILTKINKLQNTHTTHYLLTISRRIYLASSPLMGIIQLKN